MYSSTVLHGLFSITCMRPESKPDATLSLEERASAHAVAVGGGIYRFDCRPSRVDDPVASATRGMMGVFPQAPHARSLMPSRLLSITELAQGACFFHYLACGKIRFPQWTAVVEGVAVELYRSAYLACHWSNLDVLPSQDRLQYALHGAVCRGNVGYRIRHRIWPRP